MPNLFSQRVGWKCFPCRCSNCTPQLARSISEGPCLRKNLKRRKQRRGVLQEKLLDVVWHKLKILLIVRSPGRTFYERPCCKEGGNTVYCRCVLYIRCACANAGLLDIQIRYQVFLRAYEFSLNSRATFACIGGVECRLSFDLNPLELSSIGTTYRSFTPSAQWFLQHKTSSGDDCRLISFMIHGFLH